MTFPPAVEASQDDGGRVVRPYMLTGGRIRPAHHRFELTTLVVTTGVAPAPDGGPERQAILDYCEERGLPFIVAVNCFDGARRFTPSDIKFALGLDHDVPVLLSDARDRASARHVLIRLIEQVRLSRRAQQLTLHVTTGAGAAPLDRTEVNHAAPA